MKEAGFIGGGSGPLAFDRDGNLYYAQGYIFNDDVDVPKPIPFLPYFINCYIYRFDADEVRKVMDRRSDVKLEITPHDETDEHVWTTIDLTSGPFPPGFVLGVASMVFVKDVGLIITTTFANNGSQLRHYPINPDGTSSGYTVLAVSDGRMSEIRYRRGKIYFNDPDGIYRIDVDSLYDD